MNEVEEMDCGGSVQRQYVYGHGTDELITQDTPKVGFVVTSTLCLQQNGATQDPVAGLATCANVLSTGQCGPCEVSSPDLSCHPCLQSAAYPFNTTVEEAPPVPDCLVCMETENSGFQSPPTVAWSLDHAGCQPCMPDAHVGVEADGGPHGSGYGILRQSCSPCTVNALAVLGVTWDSSNPTNPVVTQNLPDKDTCNPVELGQRLYFLQDEQMTVHAVATMMAWLWKATTTTPTAPPPSSTPDQVGW
jgi:hypothetical protein